MRLLLTVVTGLLAVCISSVAMAQATAVLVNDGTGSLVTIPIPGGNGLSVTVGTGTAALPLENLYNSPNATQLMLGDDDNALIPLQFSFPFFGQSFTDSWMHSNGVVSFQNPGITGSFCCSGLNLSTLTDTRYNYSIMPLWTDLININGSQYYRTTGNSATYGWYNVSEFHNPASVNSFEVTIKPTGEINTRLGGVMISQGIAVTSGMTGNLAAGEYFQYYHGSGLQINSSNQISWSAHDGTGTGNICYSDPLLDPSCPGYQQAYFNQQCTISALWDASCPGYQQAYFNQQCTISALYNSACQGYEIAYFEQQCTISGLYSRECSNYSEAYAKKNILNTDNTTSTSVSSQSITEPQLVADPIVNNIITTKPTASSEANPVAVVKLNAPAAPANTTTTKEEKKADNKSNTTQSVAAESKSDNKPKTAREALAENQREKAKAEAVTKGMELANEMGKAANMQAQMDVQNAVIAAIGFTPGFDAYNKQIIVEQQFYQPYQVYGNQKNIDNRANLRMFSGTDSVHQQMIESQYKK
jgi:hypothetical protein